MINLTPHDIVVRTASGDVTFPASGEVARAIPATQRAVAIVEGCPCVEPPRYTGVDGLPDDGCDVLVSFLAAPAVVASGYPGRVFVPDSGPGQAIRDERGQIEAVRRLILWSRV